MSNEKFVGNCSHCAEEYILPLAILGKKVRCRTCRRTFRLTETVLLPPEPPNIGGLNIGGLKSAAPSTSAASPSVKRVADHPEAESLWKIGDVILGMYEVRPLAATAEFAEGGLGIVQKVYHREWDMELAVKVPKRKALDTEDGKAAYERECQTWVALGLHPNIVTCYLIRRIDNIPRLFAEYVADGTLGEMIQSGRLYEGDFNTVTLRILDISIQFAWGLEHAHRQGLIHLDIKPGNVMMAGWVPKVTDFGLTQAIGVTEKVDTGMGTDGGTGSIRLVRKGDSSKHHLRSSPSQQDHSTPFPFVPPKDIAVTSAPVWEGLTPAYCSPEQYQAVTMLRDGDMEDIPAITLQSDIWSYALSVAAMFYGGVLCKKGGQTAPQTFEYFVRAAVTKSKKIPPIPAGVVDILRHCFQVEPTKRPKNMGDIADRLMAVYQQITGSSYPRKKPPNTTWTADSINNRAASLLDLGKFPEAVDMLKQAATLQPWHPEITYNQTILEWRRGQITDLEAVAQLDTLCKMKPDVANTFYGLGLLQRERGNVMAATTALEHSLTLKNQPMVRRILDNFPSSQGSIAQKNSVYCAARFLVQYSERLSTVWIDTKQDYLFVIEDEKKAVLRSAATGKETVTFSLQENFRSPDTPIPPGTQVGISDDYRFELVAENVSGELCVRSTDNTKSIHLLPLDWGQTAAAQSELVVRDGDLYHFEIEGDSVRVFLKKNGKKFGGFSVRSDDVTALAVSGDQRWVVTGDSDCHVRLWELIPSRSRLYCRCLHTFGNLQRPVTGAFVSSQGQFAMTLHGSEIRVWNLSLLTNADRFHAPILLSSITSSEEVGSKHNRLQHLREVIKTSIAAGEYKDTLTAIAEAATLPNWEIVRKKYIPWDILAKNCVRQKPTDVVLARTLPSQGESTYTVAITDDGSTAVSAGRDTKILVWNLQTGVLVKELCGHFDWVRNLVFSADNKAVVSGSWDQTVRIWNIADGQCVRSLPEKIKSLTQMTMCPNNRFVAVGTGTGNIIFWNLQTDETFYTRSGHVGEVRTLRFSRCGRYLLSGSEDGALYVWETATQKQFLAIPSGNTSQGQGGLLQGTGFGFGAGRGTGFGSGAEQGFGSNYGQKFGTGQGFGRGFGNDTGSKSVPEQGGGQRSPVVAGYLTTDIGSVFYLTKDGGVHRWSFTENKSLYDVAGHLAEPTAMAVLQDERFAITAAKDKTIRIWDIQRGTLCHQTGGGPAPFTSLVMDYSGQILLAGTDQSMACQYDVFWDFALPDSS